MLFGGAGSNFLFGDDGRDRFVISADEPATHFIGDSVPGSEKIDLRGGPISFGQIDFQVSDSGAVSFELGDGAVRVNILGVARGDLSAEDFLFG